VPASAADPAAKTLCLFAPNSARGPGSRYLPEAVTGPKCHGRPNPADVIGVCSKFLEIPLVVDSGEGVSAPSHVCTIPRKVMSAICRRDQARA